MGKGGITPIIEVFVAQAQIFISRNTQGYSPESSPATSRIGR